MRLSVSESASNRAGDEINNGPLWNLWSSCRRNMRVFLVIVTNMIVVTANINAYHMTDTMVTFNSHHSTMR